MCGSSCCGYRENERERESRAIKHGESGALFYFIQFFTGDNRPGNMESSCYVALRRMTRSGGGKRKESTVDIGSFVSSQQGKRKRGRRSRAKRIFRITKWRARAAIKYRAPRYIYTHTHTQHVRERIPYVSRESSSNRAPRRYCVTYARRAPFVKAKLSPNSASSRLLSNHVCSTHVFHR